MEMTKKTKCACGNPSDGLFVHRTDGPCYVPADVRLEAIKRLFKENQRLTALLADFLEAKAKALAKAASGPTGKQDLQAAEAALVILDEIHPGNMTPMAEAAWRDAIEKLRAALDDQGDDDNRLRIERLVRENQRLTAILADFLEAKADARRYQFIVSGGAYIEPDGERIYMAIDRGAYYSTKSDLDAAIDAAIKQSGG